MNGSTAKGIPSAHTRSYAAEGALAYAPVIEWLRSPAFAGQFAARWISLAKRAYGYCPN
ncbi:MAG: hypothetical protein R2867_38545 [Caldilineaceae bacterium]